MKRIPLTKGYYATVDDTDYPRLSQYKWHSVIDRNHKKWRVYAGRWGKEDRRRKNVSKRQLILMHRDIVHAPSGLDVDHRDGNTLMNIRSNLRECTRSQNCMNQRSMRGAMKGVYLRIRGGRRRYEATICKEYKQICIGVFRNKRVAIEARKKAEISLFGSFSPQCS